MSRGGKKITSKNAAHLEPATVGDIAIAAGREIDHLTTARTIEIFPVLRQTYEKSIAAQVLVALIDHLSKAGQADVRVFDFLHQSLFALERAERLFSWFIDAFALRALALFGFAPALDACVACGAKESSEWSLTVALGGRICASCRCKPEMGATLDGSPEVRQGLEQLLTGVAPMDMAPKTEPEVHRFVYQFLLFYSEKTFPDWARLFSL